MAAECVTSASIEGLVYRGSSDGSLDCLGMRAAEAMDQMWHKACEKGEEAERYVKNAFNAAWKTCHFSNLPHWLQDNDYLWHGHRPPLESFRACFWSIFRMHTETWNIWTHIIGCLIFTFLAINLLVFTSHPFTWEDKLVFGAFFLGAIVCLGLSSTYHTLSCHSPHVGRLFSRLDYCGIALLIAGSFVPFLYYGFYCHYVTKLCYLLLVTALGVLTVIVSLWERFSAPNFRHMRAGVFMSFGLSGIIPGFHWLIAHEYHLSIPSFSVQLACLLAMGALYITGALLYAFRIPERFYPGKFDCWFHSHQIFHVLVIAAAVCHYFGIQEMALYRLTSQEAVCKA